jgi:alpha-beta hydrolase superfamily lysophospholipase
LTTVAAISSVARTSDGIGLRTCRWPAPGAPRAPRAHLLLVLGVAEHVGRYPYVASQLAGAGIETHTYDQRGFDASGGHRAYVDRWSQYHEDLEERLVEAQSAARGLPVVLYGHSMGGLAATGFDS